MEAADKSLGRWLELKIVKGLLAFIILSILIVIFVLAINAKLLTGTEKNVLPNATFIASRQF